MVSLQFTVYLYRLLFTAYVCTDLYASDRLLSFSDRLCTRHAHAPFYQQSAACTECQQRRRSSAARLKSGRQKGGPSSKVSACVLEDGRDFGTRIDLGLREDQIELAWEAAMETHRAEVCMW